MSPKSRKIPRGLRRLSDVHPFIVILVTVGLIFVCWKVCATVSDSHGPVVDRSVGADSLLRVKLPDGTAEQIVSYPGFFVSFNREMHQPNYVAWELTADETDGEAGRVGFDVDPDVDGSATLDDYRGSGYDRGHMMPAADAKWSEDVMRATHYLTNICPQDHKLNAGAWQTVESNCRRWALRDSALLIVCGPVLSDRLTRTIGESAVPVPERFFKVILAPWVKPPRGIAFVMPNGVVDGGAQAAAVSIDEVERITGFDFFPALDDSIEDVVEAQCAYHLWQRRR